MTNILVIEDERGIAFALQADLAMEGYGVKIAANGESGLMAAKTGSFDLILLDVMLPGRDGFEICRELRRSGSRTPIILLTARAQETEKILGLELGADDYVTKPFSPRELRARIRAVLRRGHEPRSEQFRCGDVEIDFARCEVKRSGIAVDLSALEFKLLDAFVRNQGRVLSREQLIEAAWGENLSLNDRVVDNHIVNLRRKLEADPARPRHLLNVRGLGYRFDA
jgi:DNA-binding response OmpR family regulator